MDWKPECISFEEYTEGEDVGKRVKGSLLILERLKKNRYLKLESFGLA